MNYSFGGGGKRLISNFKHIKKTKYNDLVERTCLMCDEKFISTHKAHRRCGHCDYALSENCKDKGALEHKVTLAQSRKRANRHG